MSGVDFSTIDHRAIALDTVPALISFFDTECVCQFANEPHQQWYGRSPDELTGQHIREFLGSEAYAQRRLLLDRVLGGETVSFEALVPHRDGTLREATVRYVPHLGADGLDGFYVLIVDLDRQTHRFHRVFEATVVAYWEIDLVGVHEWIQSLPTLGIDDPVAHIRTKPGFVRAALDLCPVLNLNGRGEELFGVSREEALVSSFGRWCPPDSEKHFEDNFTAYLKGERGFQGDTVMRRADGSTFPVHLSSAFPLKEVSRPAGTFAVIDISDRVAREQDLARANADLAHAARIASLGELMASIAHEVNQPLAAVVANGNAALRWLNRDQPNMVEALGSINRMIQESTRASEIIARTRQMATKSTSDRTALSPNAVVEEALVITRWQLAGLKAEVSLQLASDLPEIFADRVQMQQVLINLLINAAQAMADHGSDRRSLTVRTMNDGSTVAFEVADTGPGIPESLASQLFNSFYTTKSDGMGMGLSVTKTIVEAHGGQISIARNEDGGATFRFTIPL